MAEINRINLKLVTRLVEADIISEKAVTSMKLKDILSIPNITKQELSAICDLQDAIKTGSFLAFLAVPEKEKKAEMPQKEVVADET